MAKKTASSKKESPKKNMKAKPVKSSNVKMKASEKPVAAKVSKMTVMAAKKSLDKQDKTNSSKAIAVPSAGKTAALRQVAESTDKIKIDRDSMTEEQIKWAEMYNKFKDTQASQYDMKSTFKAGAPILHKILGWGWVVSNDNDRLEVLFKDGKRVLISNYRG